MNEIQFYFLLDQYYLDFPDKYLMRNKMINGVKHFRPYFFAFKDNDYDEIFWIIPISSKIDKYKKIYNKSIEKYKYCDLIYFGKVTNREAAFLIQNICSTTKDYLIPYLNKRNEPIRINNLTARIIIKKAKKILKKIKHGSKIIFPDSLLIYNILVNRLDKQ